MRRLSDDRGAVATLVALLMVPLVICGAVSIDVAGLWSERQQLQNGADAAALAVARQCAAALVAELASCGDYTTTAQSYATSNMVSGPATAGVISGIVPTIGHVAVTSAGTRQHSFAEIIGVNATTLHVTGGAEWGLPASGTAMLPVAFDQCEFLKQTGGGAPSQTDPRTILFAKDIKTSKQTQYSCPDIDNSGNPMPGGFDWLTTDSGSCHVTLTVGTDPSSDPGNSPPSACNPSDFSVLLGRTVLLPLYDSAGSNGSHGWYHIAAFAAFQLEGYELGGQYRAPFSSCNKTSVRCLSGYFTEFVDVGDDFRMSTDLSNGTFGVTVVKPCFLQPDGSCKP